MSETTFFPERQPLAFVLTDFPFPVALPYERSGGGRSFTFTGGHLHASLAEEGYRRFLVNGTLWTAGVDIPPSGSPVALAPGRLNEYLPNKPSGKEK